MVRRTRVRAHRRRTKGGTTGVVRHERKGIKEYYIKIEASDEADAHALYKRISSYLETLDYGDYAGREIKIIRR